MGCVLLCVKLWREELLLPTVFSRETGFYILRLRVAFVSPALFNYGENSDALFQSHSCACYYPPSPAVISPTLAQFHN